MQCIDLNEISSLISFFFFSSKVPALIHSTKPALHLLFQYLIQFPNDQIDHCLEVYARNLLPNFTSIGNEVKKISTSKSFNLLIFLGFKTSIN